MSQKLITKSTFLPVFAFYFLPIFAWIFFTYFHSGYDLSFIVFLAGVVLLCMGSALLLAFLKTSVSAEKVMVPAQGILPVQAPEPVVEHVVVDRSEEYLNQIDRLKEQLIEKEQMLLESQNNFEELKESNDEWKALSQRIESERLKKEQELSQKIEEMELQGIQKQQMVEQLETQIHDLRYEIKTLLQLTEVDYSKFVMEQPSKSVDPAPLPAKMQGNVKREEEARILLRRCLDIAQKMSFPTRPSMQSAGVEVSALDLRRLTDALKEETGALVLFYNPKERKVLYASREAKPLLGYAPETLAHQFLEIAEEGISFWDAAVSQLATKPQSTLVLGMKTKAGDELAFNVLLGSVPLGGFKGYAVAVFYPQ